MPALAGTLLLSAGTAAQPAEPSSQSLAQRPVDQPSGAGRTELEGPRDRQRHAWTLSFEPTVWYLGVSGEIILPGEDTATVADPRLFEDFNLDSPRLAPVFEAHARRGDWRLGITAVYFESESRNARSDRTQPAGTVPVFEDEWVTASMRYASLELQAGWRFFEYADGGTREGDDRFVAEAELTAGARFYFVDIDVEVEPASVARSGTEPVSTGERAVFGHPIVGTRLAFTYFDWFRLDLETDIGAFGSGGTTSFGAQVAAGFSFELTEQISLQVGYRNQFVRFKDGVDDEQFKWTGGIAGIYGGVRVLF